MSLIVNSIPVSEFTCRRREENLCQFYLGHPVISYTLQGINQSPAAHIMFRHRSYTATCFDYWLNSSQVIKMCRWN